MTADTPAIGEALEQLGEARGPVTVRLSRELITLLSEQLYSSPSKAVEELVVNSFDADAKNCWVYLPSLAGSDGEASVPVIGVLDDGSGMDEAGLSDLWRVGASSKRSEQTARIRNRTQIGKFGIGKLATYALAEQITYVTSTGDGDILSVTLSFSEFTSVSQGEPDEPVVLEVRAVSTAELVGIPGLAALMKANQLDMDEFLAADHSWTLVLLEQFKPAASKLTPGRLRWVLSTAMPVSEFTLHLNGEPVESSKSISDPVVSFSVAELPESRVDRLTSLTGHTWAKQTVTRNGSSEIGLVSDLHPSGITGSVVVTRQPIYGGKSADLIRSHGYFIRVRGRLISEDDALFGLQPLSLSVFNRFRADLEIDDLDADITAPRESAGASERVLVVQDVLAALFNEARVRYEAGEQKRFSQETRREDQRSYVYPRFVERPVADALLRRDEVNEQGEVQGTDADEGWFYLKKPSQELIGDLANNLYSITSREPYTFSLENAGRDARLVEFVPETRNFLVNSDHELALAFKDEPAALNLLYNVATAETLLEVYLREVGLSPALVGEVLERRDGLFRSLAQEQLNSPAAIAAALRNAASNDRDLEVALVIAARSLGFVAKHMGNGGKADGIARFTDYSDGQKKITLEAKSSGEVPSLSALDFAGLHQHMEDEDADACLVIAPSYPGQTQGDYAAAALRAERLKISCWTIDQLARVVEAVGTRDITARSVLDIVLNHFTPDAVTSAIEDLLSDPANAPRALAVELLRALRAIDDIAPRDKHRSLDMLSPDVARAIGRTPSTPELRRALVQLAGASQGSITLRGEDNLVLHTSLEEVERRTAAWARNMSSGRHGSKFHDNGIAPDHT